MSELEMRDLIDWTHTGLPDNPDVAGIIAGGRRRRRRRTQTAWGAAVLATVAGVAQVAFLAGTHLAPSASPGPAAGGPATGHSAEMTAAVTEALPSGKLVTHSESFGLGRHLMLPGDLITPEGQVIRMTPVDKSWSSGVMQVYAVQGLRNLTVMSFTGSRRIQPCFDVCHGSVVDGRAVTVWDLASAAKHVWVRTVEVYTDGSAGDSSTVRVSAFSTKSAGSEPDRTLPSAETLTALALDERLLPPEE